MESIVTGMDEKHQSQVLVAWLVDQIPPEFQHLVHVVKAESSSLVREQAPDVNTVEGALAHLAAQAEVSTSVRKLVLTLAGAFCEQK